MRATRRILAKLRYRGGAYRGWQAQPGAPNIQGAVMAALKNLTGDQGPLAAPSRTDAGVHAKGQLACFDLTSSISLNQLFKGLNNELPSDIAVVDLVEVPPDFQVRQNEGKRYIYRIWTAIYSDPFFENTHWWVPGQFDLDKMLHAAPQYLGSHDFCAFRDRCCQGIDTNKSVTRFDITSRQIEAGRGIEVTIEGKAFLHKQIRIMVGTLVDIARNRRPANFLDQALNAKAYAAQIGSESVRTGNYRGHAGQTAPAHGLTLDQVFLTPDPFETRELEDWRIEGG